MGGAELEFVREAFASNYIAPLGPMVDAFEREFSACTGIPHCLAVSSGTAATHLALRHLLGGLSAGFKPPTAPRPLVLASTLTFIGSVTPAVFEGCDIVFIDCDRDTWNMDPALLEEELAACAKSGRLPAAVIPTDLYGQCCNLPHIVELCNRYGVPVICDSAEAVGAHYRKSAAGLPCGALTKQGRRGPASENSAPAAGRTLPARRPPLGGKKQPVVSVGGPAPAPASSSHHAGYDAWAAAYSFNGNKIITTSGGGMLASHDRNLIEHARKLATQARDPAPHYEHTEIGFNYRMSNIVAAIGRGQLQVLDRRVEQKRRVFARYHQRLAAVPGITFMPEAPHCRGNRWLTVILIDPRKFGANTRTVREALECENIEARPVWKPMHLQPVFGACRLRSAGHGVETCREAANRYGSGRRVVSEKLFASGLCLPSGTSLSEAALRTICDTVQRVAVSKP